jgi:hypothetical protein
MLLPGKTPEGEVRLQVGVTSEPHVAKCGHAPQARREAPASARLPYRSGETEQDGADQQQLGGIGQWTRPRWRAGVRRRPRNDHRRGNGRRCSRFDGCGTRRTPARARLEGEGKAHGYGEGGDQCREQQDTKPFPHDPHGYVTTTWIPLERVWAVRSTVPLVVDEITSDVPRGFEGPYEPRHWRSLNCRPKLEGNDGDFHGSFGGIRGSFFHKLKTTPAYWTVLRSTIVGTVSITQP